LDNNTDISYSNLAATCRAFDTRGGTSPGKIQPGTTRNFSLKNAALVPGQGGDAGCVVPADATAVFINLVAVDANGFGDLRAWATDRSQPTTAAMNYFMIPGQIANVANGIVIPICVGNTVTCPTDITILAEGNAVHVIGDLQGYYHKFPKDLVKSFVVTRDGSFVFAPIGTSCGNYGAISLSVTAPVAGKVVVEATGDVRINHSNATTSEVDLFIGTSTSDCPGNYGHDSFMILASTLPSGASFFSIPVRRVASVLAGSTTTFYLNSQTFGGAGHLLAHGGIDITFTPDPNP